MRINVPKDAIVKEIFDICQIMRSWKFIHFNQAESNKLYAKLGKDMISMFS